MGDHQIEVGSGRRVPGEEGATSPQPSRVLQASINLSLTSIIACHERISYVGNNADPRKTIFRQSADFVAQGAIAAGTMGARVGKKVEQVSVDRFVLTLAMRWLRR